MTRYSARCWARVCGKSAVSVYVLVAIAKKRLNLSRSIYEILQILSLNLFEKTPLDTALTLAPAPLNRDSNGSPLILFN